MSTSDDRQEGDETPRQRDGQVSEVASFEPSGEPAPIDPSDATSGAPEGESGRPDEGTVGPDAPPRHGRPEPSNESSR